MLKFLMALIIAFAVMLIFRALVFTIYTVPNSELEPVFKKGDRVMVNRWSYGLRTHGGGLFPYGRFCHQSVGKGQWIAIDDSSGGVSIRCCTALPGDTVSQQGSMFVVPGKVATCAHYDYYQVDSSMLVREEQIIGRVLFVVYNHTPGYVFWHGNDTSRLLLPL